jgi:hypothetical protein
MKHRNNTKQRRRISVLVVPVMIFMCVCEDPRTEFPEQRLEIVSRMISYDEITHPCLRRDSVP